MIRNYTDHKGPFHMEEHKFPRVRLRGLPIGLTRGHLQLEK